jgi:hypothetical protein
MALIFDTGSLYASLDRSDADHQVCRHLIETAVALLLIPAPVLVEVDYWIHTRLHAGVLVALLDDIVDGAYVVTDLRPEDYRRVRELCDRYADADIRTWTSCASCQSRRRCGRWRMRSKRPWPTLCAGSGGPGA